MCCCIHSMDQEIVQVFLLQMSLLGLHHRNSKKKKNHFPAGINNSCSGEYLQECDERICCFAGETLRLCAAPIVRREREKERCGNVNCSSSFRKKKEEKRNGAWISQKTSISREEDTNLITDHLKIFPLKLMKKNHGLQEGSADISIQIQVDQEQKTFSFLATSIRMMKRDSLRSTRWLQGLGHVAWDQSPDSAGGQTHKADWLRQAHANWSPVFTSFHII